MWLVSCRIRSTQTVDCGPAAGSEGGPAGSGTVAHIARADRNRARLSIPEMGAEHGPVSGCELRPPCDAHNDDAISEDSRLLWLVGQRRNAPKGHEEGPTYHQQNDPTPAAERPGLARFVGHSTAGWMSPPRRVSDAG